MVNALVPGPSGLGLIPGKDTVLCPWARHLTHSYNVSLHPCQKMGTGGNPAIDLHPILRGKI